MSDPKYRPRDWAAPEDRKLFGKTDEISWLEGASAADLSKIDASRLQHVLTVMIRKRLREKGYTVRSYAERAGISYDRMAKVIRGEAVMRLEDLADVELILGLAFAPPGGGTAPETPRRPRFTWVD
jgi:hypothetical protein